ncbi:FecR family protein [Anseongella ginsenosidimutans]|uniref:FecR family protein n=1 Tax=Anseongella ginsenosidimutans TaxID=496056 RepID=A0A4R3KTI7_9SPHI|nr:FecR domain-containing protein [Anseongella ginsenosidimutans]QEC53437.1 DUF4974 domain-containing protein [Anseongella ginsenosidimutans]TCS88327.1 FecR family protein [Anseongella ginsenosidimutans]
MDQRNTEALFEKYLQGKSTPEETERIHAWLEQLNNDEEKWSGKRGQEQKEYLAGLYEDVRHSIMKREENKRRGKGRSIPFKLTFPRIAAALVLLCGLSFLFYINRPADKVAPNEYIVEATTGEDIKELRLSDGSVVWLNKGSSLQHSEEFTAGPREVFLEGEAFFQVAPDASRPFIIHTGGMKTRVLGTSFNVQAYKGEKEMRVVVVTGQVEVSAPSGQNDKVLLTSKQMATYTPDEKQLNKKTIQSTEQYTAWKDGKLLFRQTPMSEVAAQLERAFGLKIKMENSAIRHCKITGRFDRSQAASLTIEAICKSIEARFRIKDGTVFIDGQGCGKK